MTLTGCTTTSQSPAVPEQSFQELLEQHWENANAEQVFFRSDPDAWRMNGKLAEFTPDARRRRKDFNDRMLSALELIIPTQLGEQERISYEIFLYERQTERDSYENYNHVFPFTSLFGYHTYFAEAPASMAFLMLEDYENYLISLEDFPRYNRENIALLRQGIALGYTHYCESIADYGKTIDAHIVDTPTESALYVPFEKFPAHFDTEQQEALATRGAELIESNVVPAYQALADFFTKEYLPNCRQFPGINKLEHGSRYYKYLISYFTTTDMSAYDIHELGLAEVKRIRGEMKAIIDVVKFDGNFAAFLQYLRDEPRFYAKSVEELLGKAALISKSIEGEMPKYFGLLPRNTFSIRPNPGRGTFYMPSSGDGTTSGVYFLGTARLDSQPFYTLEALTLHEAMPGHHLQTALAQELDVPSFRRNLYHSAFGEGWGLYSEWLGKEMGFYEDPYSDFGRLTYEAWRACRLVVDTGIHGLDWTRQQAIDYMLENTGLSEFEITREVDRYITWPAQALSYKIGELRIKALRQEAEKALGGNFDLRAFHDTVIGNGSLPIAVLERLVREWIVGQHEL
ncbi:MAG: DUF885 domain-containing protein [Pseudomonadales bacterium]